MNLKPRSETIPQKSFLLLLPLLLATGVRPTHAECDPRGGFFAGFAGQYRVDLKTSQTRFQDFLEVRDITRHPGMANAREEFGGTYTVPDRFAVPVEDGVLVLSASHPEHDLSMNFRIDGENLLGEAVLVKLPDGCHCGDRP